MCRRVSICFVLLSIFLSSSGCKTRQFFYDRADQDAHFLVHEKSDGLPWELPSDFSAETNPASRHYLPGSLVRPSLPGAVTPLYSYDLSAIRANVRVDPEQESTAPQVGQPGKLDELRGTAISPDAWNAIPEAYRKRMLDFETIREEAEFSKREFGQAIDTGRDTDVPKLTLRDIVDIAIINSRDYQSQKETLYLTALDLARERFQFRLNPSSNGLTSGSNFSENRALGTTQSGLSIPSGLGFQKVLATGGDLFARFANDIILTFNGTEGFVSDVSSSVIFELAQPLIQTDVRFESLTSAERNLVYAVRDFARFRKEFFVDFASSYYDLIRTFRQIEINSQNYFSLVREFKRAEAEFRTGAVSRVQVDQVEQNLLSGRGSLISTVVGVERSLDSLKLNLGIPVETRINIDLTELNELTRLDQVSVSANSINRILQRLKTSLTKPDRVELSSTTSVLLERVVESARIDPKFGTEKEIAELKIKRQAYVIDYARLTAAEIFNKLQEEVNSPSPSPSSIFQRSQAHSDALLNLITQQIDYARLTGDQSLEEKIKQFEDARSELVTDVEKLDAQLSTIIQERGLDELPKLVESGNQLRGRIVALVSELDTFIGITVEPDAEKDLQRMTSDISLLIERLDPVVKSQLAGLTPIDIDQDEAMITALVLRFDMMNQRGSLADDWRQIKLAADELKSVINLNASQRFNSDPTKNKPFDFALDDSQSALSLSLDAPINRFNQRNIFRSRLIGYQRAIRSMNLLEDNIKLSIRNDLRNLALDQQQYLIAVASAALAYERVVSTSIQFRLGTPGVAARDFLEAQTAYINALSDVASRHIDYIVDRTQLFLDLEVLTVDESGFWDDIRNESIVPGSYFQIPQSAQPIYGELPPVNYSDEIRQMLFISPDFPLSYDFTSELGEVESGEVESGEVADSDGFLTPGSDAPAASLMPNPAQRPTAQPQDSTRRTGARRTPARRTRATSSR